MAISHYLKYRVNLKGIHERLYGNYKRINVFIDMPSIARGFYNKNVMLMEISDHVQTQQMPVLFLNELKEFLNNLYQSFKSYDPRFIIHYDAGVNKQNSTIMKGYKEGRGSSGYHLLEDEQMQLFKRIKNYYYKEVAEKFVKPNISTVIYLDDYEADLVPHYCINNNYAMAQDSKTLNVVLSVDKDLLQCCKFNNTIQAVSVYKKSEGKIDMQIYDSRNALGFMYKGFKPGIITAAHVPLVLALAGDKADGIKGLKGVGNAKAIALIMKHRLPAEYPRELPGELSPYLEQIQQNYKVTDFGMQASRIDMVTTNDIDEKLKELRI